MIRRFLKEYLINPIVTLNFGEECNIPDFVFDFEEAEDLLSDIKLGTDLGIIEELTDSKVKELELYLKPANLQKRVGKALTGFERDLERAKVVKQIIG